MGRKWSRVRTAVIAAAAAFTVLALLLGIYYGSQMGNQDSGITLPQTQSTVTAKPPSQLLEDPFLTVTRENVLDILRSLVRPIGYHQVLSATTYWSEGDLTVDVDLYGKNGVLKAKVHDGTHIKHFLSNGETLYLWYEQEKDEVFQTILAEGTTLEDLLGVPTYETVMRLPEESILEAGYLTLGEADGTPCIYIACGLKDSMYTDRYWIDVENQILYRADGQQGESQIYLLEQKSLEILPQGETELDDVFMLPDGSCPFEQQLKGT